MAQDQNSSPGYKASRSLQVRQDYVPTVKAAVSRKGYHRQKDLAENLELSLATVSNFLNGKPVDRKNFEDISEELGLSWQKICDQEYLENVDMESSPVEEVIFSTNSEVNTPFIYVERVEIEAACCEVLRQAGSLLHVKAPHLIGKTSLIAKVLAQLNQENYRIVLLNLHLAEQQDFANLECFLKWFCASVGQSLILKNRLADYWDEEFSTSKVNCTDYFERYLLPQINNPLVLCLDEVERIFPKAEIAADFLSLLRAWHEAAKTRPIWQRLRLVIVYSTEILIALNVNESPFNVGTHIDLPELTLRQVQDLSQQHGLAWTTLQTEQLMDLVGGHPHLVEQAFAQIKLQRDCSIEQLLQTAATDGGIYRTHLRWLWGRIQQSPELHESIKAVMQADCPVRLGEKQSWQLYQLGLVHRQGNEVIFRNHLYKKYLSDRLGDQS